MYIVPTDLDESIRAATDAQPMADDGPATLPFPVVGIGASAGCVDALVRLFAHLPPETGMAFVVIVHPSTEHESQLDQILAHASSMPVLQVREKVAIRHDHLYVVSPTHTMTMNGGDLEVVDHLVQTPGGLPATLENFFRRLADIQRERAVCVVLSGTGADGSLSVSRVKERGGVTLVQAPDDAEHPSMPAHAIATGAVDFVLAVDDIGPKLVSLWQNAQRMELPPLADAPMQIKSIDSPLDVEAAERALADVMSMLRDATGHDFHHYKRATVLRRIERRMQVNSVATLPAYRAHLGHHPEESWALLNDLLISVTSFFRDQEAFESLDAQLPTVVHPERSTVRAWVAGCATGEEAYSVAMLLTDRVRCQYPRPTLQVFASDIDDRAIALARLGLYPDTVLGDVSPSRLSEFMQKENGKVRIRKELREKVLFAAHNLLRDPPFSNLDLVCCRNLLIYLDRHVQLQVLQLFHFALRPGGLLFLGSSESADLAGDLFTPVDARNRIYRAVSQHRSSRELPELPGRKPTVLPLPLRPQRDKRSVLGDLHERSREALASPSVLIDAEGNIVHSTLRASAFLRFAPGQPSHDVLEVVHPELRVSLQAALIKAWQEPASVESRAVRLERHGHPSWVTMHLRPVTGAEVSLMLVFFEEAQFSLGLAAVDGTFPDPMLAVLELELQRTRERLRGSVGESASSTEELRALNEELQAINEELRSAAEELKTSKEELQSMNEEFYTVNKELKAKVDEASQTNDDLRNIVASTDIATVFVDRHMLIRRYTPRASQLFNLIPADVGRSLLDITHRLDYPELERDAIESFESLRLIEREVAGQDQRTYLVRVLPYRTLKDVIDGAVLSFIDISTVRKAQTELKTGEANLRLVAESTQDFAIIAMDLGGLVTAWNEGARRIFGFDEAEMLGRGLEAIFTAEDRAAGAPLSEIRRAREEGRAADERWHVAKDGRVFYVSGIMTPIHEGGELIGFAKIARDRTEGKRAEDQLQALLLQEKETRAELQRAITMKDEFLAVMSHELKHPLNLIHVNAELLSRMPQVRDTPSLTRAADIIRRTVLSQAKIIDDLLDLSRMRTGKLTLQITSVQWLAVVDSVLGAVADDAQARQLVIRTDLDPQASMVDADPVRAEQIVWNLVSNALKFTPAGGEVRLRLWVDGAFSRLDVTDTGQGIAPDFIGQVFEMFRQADRSTTRAQGGMGIGLALAKNLAEAQGGKMAAASPGVGQGATFSVWLPRADAASEPASPFSSLPALTGLRILLVDDAEDALQSFALLLELEGAVVTPVGSGRSALDALAANRFDLLISDVAMPGMDGHELVGVVRRGLAPDLPAIALTGFGRPMDARRALAAGFDAHLAKPVVIEELLEAIQDLPRCIEQRRASQERLD